MASINRIINEKQSSVDSMSEWSGPHMVARMIRKAIYPMKQIAIHIKSSTVAFRQYAGRQNSRTLTSELEKRDPELGNQVENSDLSLRGPALYGQTQFRRLIEETFNSDCRDAVLNVINDYETSLETFSNSEYDADVQLRRRLQTLLWGYPKLIDLFYDSWYPHLSPIHRIYRLDPDQIQHFLTCSSSAESRDRRIRKVNFGHQIVAFKIFRDGYWEWNSSLKVSTPASTMACYCVEQICRMTAMKPQYGHDLIMPIFFPSVVLRSTNPPDF